MCGNGWRRSGCPGPYAGMYRDLEMGRLLAYHACWLLSQGLDARAAMSSAKLKLSRVYPAITRLAHQVTGGVGYYTEYPLELYTRRALAAASTYGGADDHAARLGELLWGEQAEMTHMHAQSGLSVSS
ncbi:hypothetical protein C2W62_35210 [Candidatus Entotheonella serta]|nr:hypothetical protein C2W62_35210 [Candidatus Entotheonella serta]